MAVHDREDGLQLLARAARFQCRAAGVEQEHVDLVAPPRPRCDGVELCRSSARVPQARHAGGGREAWLRSAVALPVRVGLHSVWLAVVLLGVSSSGLRLPPPRDLVTVALDSDVDGTTTIASSGQRGGGAIQPFR